MKVASLLLLLALCCPGRGLAQKTALDSLYNQAIDKTAAGDVAGATALLVTATQMAEAAQNIPLLCRIEVTMGKIGLISENNEAVEQATRRAETYCSACRDTAHLARMYLQKGVLDIKRNQYDAAIQWFRRAAEFYLVKQDSTGAANALAKVGNVLEVQGRYAEAQPYYLQFYETARKAPESWMYLTANIYLTGNYLYCDQPQKARIHNDVVRTLSKKLQANYEYSEALRYDALIARALGQHEEAFDKLNRFALYYQDTLMNERHLREAEELKAKYEAEKKETELALQKAELDRQRLRTRALAGGLALALLAGGFFFALVRQLRKRNQEKEFLLKEIHHRVKNNLQILSSLLRLQARHTTDETALGAMREGQSRVEAMGLIHQKLYLGDELAQVEMKDYLEQFAHNILDSFGIDDDRIRIRCALEPLYLDVDTAIPVGLIINELVTNALKYAFPDGRSGVIRIDLRKNDKNQLCLTVADDGVGTAGAQRDDRGTGFGVSLVQLLSKKLKGRPEVLATPRGYATQIVFEKID